MSHFQTPYHVNAHYHDIAIAEQSNYIILYYISVICGGGLKNSSITNSSLCLVQSIVSWDEAKAICESAEGYRLASLPSVEAVQWVESISMDPLNTAGTLGTKHVK